MFFQHISSVLIEPHDRETWLILPVVVCLAHSQPCIIVASSAIPMAPHAELKRDDNDGEDNDDKGEDYEDD